MSFTTKEVDVTTGVETLARDALPESALATPYNIPPPPYFQPLPPINPNSMFLGTLSLQPMVGSSPTRLRCPNCSAEVVSSTSHKTGCLTWAICGAICAAGLFIPCAWLGCQFIPFCINSCKDVVHMCPNCKGSSRLGKYEDVLYDPHTIHLNHIRVKKSLDSHLYLNFYNFNKNFKLKLSPSKTLFNHESIEIDNENYPIDEFWFYSGELIDEPNSKVTGSIIDGVFFGIIETENGIYQVESSKRYDGKFASHSIIYHENDIMVNSTHKKRDTSDSNFVHGCASDKDFKWMQKVQEDAYKENFGDSSQQNSSFVNQKDDIKTRSKRAVSPIQFPNNSTTCTLYLRVDPFYYNLVYNNEGKQSKTRTLNYIANYLNTYVTNLNSIYSSLQFFTADGLSYYTGFNFAIYRTRIITNDMCNNKSSLSTAEQKMCLSYLDVTTFLNYVSLDDYSSFCTSFTFTGRDFGTGTLGLAWIASPSGSIGGICEKPAYVNGKTSSLNCGIVTILSYQTRVSEYLTSLTFAHEIGHNMGSQHDSSAACTPGGTSGNYIMYGQASTGQLANNNKFSQCSKDYMSAVIRALVNSTKKFCFKVSTKSICGNTIVDPGEDCDCGYPSDCTEKCCNPSTCKLYTGFSCSPSQGPCCNSNCMFNNNTTSCLSETECIKTVYCNGNSSVCPSVSSQNFKVPSTGNKYQICNYGAQVCISGTCTGSICQNYNMNQCYLPGNLSDPSVNKSKLCHVACQGSATNNVCIDTFEMSIFNYTGIVLKAGSVCSGSGYCDIFSKCRVADEGSVLYKLEQFLLNPDTSSTIQTWFQTYWWAILLIFLAFLLVLGVIGALIFKLTPTQNPKKMKENKPNVNKSNQATKETSEKILRKRTVNN